MQIPQSWCKYICRVLKTGDYFILYLFLEFQPHFNIDFFIDILPNLEPVRINFHQWMLWWTACSFLLSWQINYIGNLCKIGKSFSIYLFLEFQTHFILFFFLQDFKDYTNNSSNYVIYSSKTKTGSYNNRGLQQWEVPKT